MNDIDYMEIIIINTNDITKIYINIKASSIIINDKLTKISNDKIKELLEIIKYWNESYHSFILDVEKFSIKLISNNKVVKTSQGSGKYPYNYKKFKRWISDVS